MYVKFDNNEDKLIVTLIGELDHHSSEEVRNKIDNKIDNEGFNKLVMNFSGVSFMDSSGIGMVIGRYKKLLNRNGVVCVTDVNQRINKVFEISGMYKIIKNYPTLEEALSSI